MKRFNEDGSERAEYREWKDAHDNYLARRQGFNNHADLEKRQEQAAKGKTVVEMLRAMTGGIMNTVRANKQKQASKKSAGAAAKHIRQKV